MRQRSRREAHPGHVEELQGPALAGPLVDLVQQVGRWEPGIRPIRRPDALIWAIAELPAPSPRQVRQRVERRLRRLRAWVPTPIRASGIATGIESSRSAPSGGPAHPRSPDSPRPDPSGPRPDQILVLRAHLQDLGFSVREVLDGGAMGGDPHLEAALVDIAGLRGGIHVRLEPGGWTARFQAGPVLASLTVPQREHLAGLLLEMTSEFRWVRPLWTSADDVGFEAALPWSPGTDDSGGVAGAGSVLRLLTQAILGVAIRHGRTLRELAVSPAALDVLAMTAHSDATSGSRPEVSKP